MALKIKPSGSQKSRNVLKGFAAEQATSKSSKPKGENLPVSTSDLEKLKGVDLMTRLSENVQAMISGGLTPAIKE